MGLSFERTAVAGDGTLGRTEPDWFVVHTLARCEKKLVEWAVREGVPAELPTYQSVRKYRGKVVRFEKVLFPGYVFLQGNGAVAARAGQNRHAARVLIPPDPDEFRRQLGEILAAARAGVALHPASAIRPGVRVQILSGPLRGLEGWVERRDEWMEVVLRLDFIGQSASVRVAAADLEVL